jgi:iron complex outermembrane receptor protein
MKRLAVAAMAAGILVWLGPASGSQAADKTPQQLDEVVVTATKYETSAKDVPASITVIDAHQIAARNLVNGDVGDLLRSVPGISLRRAYAPFPAYANIRGAGSGATLYLVNGIPTDWQISQTIPAERIERVEIIRGPASALYGANASGGVINIILKRGGKDPQAAVSGGTGSFGRWRTAVSADGRADSFDYALAAFYEEADGTNVVENKVNKSIHMIGDCEYDKHGVGFSTGYRPSERTRVQAFYNFFHNEYIRGRPNVGGDWDYHFGGAILDQAIGARLDVKAYLAYRTDDYLHLYDKGGTNYDPRQKRYMDYSEIPAEIQATFDAGAGHKITAGFFYNDQKTDQDYNDWLTGALNQQNEYRVRTLAGYLQDVWKPTDALTFTTGLRYDHWKNYDNYFSSFNIAHPQDRTDDQLTPKIGARYHFDDGTSIWASYGMGFLPPTAEQLYDDRTSGGNPRQPNPNLKAETTHSYEIGVERWFSTTARASLAGFYSYTEDKIMSWFDVNNVWINKNIGRTESYGTELALAVYPTPNWTVSANYTYNRATIDEHPRNRTLEGNFLPFSPEHMANLGVIYNRPDNFTLSGYLRYLSDQYSDDANTDRNAAGEQLMMTESVVVDLKGTKHIPVSRGAVKKLDISLSIDNLFDERYRSFYLYEDPGTTYFAEIKFVF